MRHLSLSCSQITIRKCANINHSKNETKNKLHQNVKRSTTTFSNALTFVQVVVLTPGVTAKSEAVTATPDTATAPTAASPVIVKVVDRAEVRIAVPLVIVRSRAVLQSAILRRSYR